MMDIIEGSCLDTCISYPEGIQTVITSPPYFWQRDYGVDGQLGHEETVEQYIENLCLVFDIINPYLKDDGTLFVNLGDSYYSGNGTPTKTDPKSPSRNWMRIKKRPLDKSGWDIPKKSLVGIPWLFAFAMQKRGWTLRSEIIWCRESAFPEPSVKDRPHRQHEKIFLFSKSRKYFFNRENLSEEDVWHIKHERGVRGHSAAFPKELAKRCLEVGSKVGDVVLDPFMGSGTVGVVCKELKRNFCGVELNPDYIKIATSRINLEGDPA